MKENDDLREIKKKMTKKISHQKKKIEAMKLSSLSKGDHRESQNVDEGK
jgi:hypothetical protein